MKSARIISWLERHQREVQWILLPLLLLLVAGVYGLVHFTGGVKYAYYHAMYVPILLAGALFGLRGGIAVGLLGGLVLGPYMPIEVATGELQDTSNWLYRTGFFCLIGGLAGSSRDAMGWYIERLRWDLIHDAGTGLPNREALVAELLRERRDAPHAKSGGMLAMVSMENAEELSVSFGTGATDKLMLELARRLRQVAGEDTPVYRIHATRLCLHLDQLDDVPADDLMRRFNRCLVKPLPFGELSVHADICIGMVKLEGKFSSAEELLNYAASSLVLARESSQKIVIAAGVIASYSRENVALMGQLWRALESDQLQLHYQPKIDVASGRVVGAEALLRWQHPEHGMVPPMKFIPRAEQSTLIDDLTQFVIGAALDQLVDWQGRGIDLCMAVNVSTQNLINPDFGEMVRKPLASRGIHGSQFELEITEGALINDIARVSEILHGMSGLNVILSIDDFGTGYSSLQYMNDLPMTIIKIDKVFVQPLPADTGAAHIVSATIDLCHRLDMQVVAEGVESLAALELLNRMGCDMAQGFHIARPMPAEEFAEWFKKNDGQFTRMVATDQDSLPRRI